MAKVVYTQLRNARPRTKAVEYALMLRGSRKPPLAVAKTRPPAPLPDASHRQGHSPQRVEPVLLSDLEKTQRLHAGKAANFAVISDPQLNQPGDVTAEEFLV